MEGDDDSRAQLQVVVRVRPLNPSEKEKKHFQCVFPLDKKRLLLVDPEKYENNILRQNRQHERQFIFDAAFGALSTQEDVHIATTEPLLDSVVSGYNATVFAYGATGSGKTYTMIGTKDRPGVMTLLTRSLYEKIGEGQFEVHLSYLEIYNEVIRDLLNPNSGVLDLLEDEKGNIRVPGLSSVRAPNLSRIMQILQEGNMRRTQEATEANKTSSRSHALLQVLLMRNNRPHSKLFLIDLAGSERASNTNNRGLRLKEGAAINRSLLALGNVINSLSSGGKSKFVNYRDSKLTRLLKDSLGGNAKTCMIAHVTAASGHYEETYNTLVYASRAKNIVNKVVQHRPASADPPYSEALKEVRARLQQNSLSHAVSANQSENITEQKRVRFSVSDIQYDKPLRQQQPRWQNGSVKTINSSTRKGANEKRDFASLFAQLKEQFISISDKQNRLRLLLMKANQDSYEVEMSRTSKAAIIAAWEKKHGTEEPAESIERLKADIAQLEQQEAELSEQRTKLEKALRKGQETSRTVETRLRGLANTKEQKELIDLIVRMADIQAEKISAENDLAIHNLFVKKTDNSMSKLQKYEMIADKLIEGHLDEKDREQLEHEYRVVKNQFHYHLIPLKQMHNMVSWNSLLLPKISPNSSVPDDIKPRKRESIQLPIIHSDKDLRRDSSGSSHESDGRPRTPNSLHLPRLG